MFQLAYTPRGDFISPGVVRRDFAHHVDLADAVLLAGGNGLEEVFDIDGGGQGRFERWKAWGYVLRTL